MSQAKPTSKQLNLKSLAMQTGLKFSGCPTQPETDSSGCLCIYWANYAGRRIIGANELSEMIYAPLLVVLFGGAIAHSG